MKDARQMILKDIERKQLQEIEFNAEMVEKFEAIKALKFYESRKLDILSILSNPFKH